MFRSPVYLLWMTLAAAACAAAYLAGEARRRRAAAALGEPATLERMVDAATRDRRILKAVLQTACVVLIFVSLAGPQWDVELTPVESATRQVIIAVDTSLSMTTEDVKPSRLERAKAEMSFLLDQLRGERVGIVAFAGEPIVVCPLTTDADAAKQILRSLSAGMVPVPGTGIGKAIRAATAALSRYPGQKSLILLSDGEDHKTAPEQAADEAAAQGVRIFSIGVGTLEGEPIPMRDASGALTGYKKDKKGNTVVSRLGEKTLADVAARTSGAYYRSSPAGNEAAEIVQQIQRSTASEGVVTTAHVYRNHFTIPLAAAFLLLLAELLLPDRRGALRPAARALRALRSAAAAAALLAWLLPRPGLGATAEGSLRSGNALYEKGDYAAALQDYARAAGKSPSDPRPAFNAADALYRLQQYDRSAEAFGAVGSSAAAQKLRAAAFYNLGNSLYSGGDYGGAVQAFRKAVTLDPSDAAARNNLAVALRRLKNPPPKNKNQDKKDKQRPQDQKNDKNQDQQQPKSDQSRHDSPPKTRPQDQISREDAERIMRAVSEKEKAASQRQIQKQPPKRPDVEEDW